ncbi:MAG: nucleotidyltransferase domain-containing protein [Pseudomonadota bacterium]
MSILAVLIHAPEGELHLRELARRIGKEVGVLQKAINSLESDGLIISRKCGNQRLVHFNSDHSIALEVKSLVEKCAGVISGLKQIVEVLPEVRIAFIFGSYAKGAYRGHSDIDVVIVGNAKGENSFLESIKDFEEKYGRELNYKWYSMQEYKRRCTGGDPFLQEILSNKYIVLKGQP